MDILNTKLNTKGLTLTELLVVIAIIAITTAIAVPMYISNLPRQKLKGAAQGVLGDIRLARGWAVANNEEYLICFNSKGYTIHREEGTTMDCTIINGTNPIKKTVDFDMIYSGTEFGFVSGVTPCELGMTINDAIDFSLFTARFSDRGSSVDGNNSVKSGALYLTSQMDSQLGYCVHVDGVTGRAKLYRWDNGDWE